MFVCPSCGERQERGGYCATDGNELAPTSDPLLGTEVSRYRLARLLGEGGMGRVYLGVHPTIGSRVAIKILSDDCARNAELLERFFAEAKAVNLIRHEHIISVIDLSLLPDGRPFIVMEYIEGYTLSTYVRNTHAPLGGVAQVMGEVLGGLAAAHAIGIVHRDLKPDNVLVTREGHAKVLDFGIAKLAPGLRADVSPRTKTGALLGTPSYMAPEQISGGGNVDARTDIYAAGIVLYEACTGSVPFTGDTLFDVMRAHLEQTAELPSARRPDLPIAMEQVILQAIAKDPGERFQSVKAMAQALAHAASTLPADQWTPLSTGGGPRISASGVPSGAPQIRTAPATAPPTEREPRRRTGLIVGVIAALAVVGGIALVVMSQSAPDPEPTKVAVSIDAAPVEVVAKSEVPIPTDAAVVAPPPAPPPRTTKAPPPPPTKPAVVASPPAPAPAPASTPTPPAPQAPRMAITKPADYNAKNFDPVAYLPKALALAQQLVPDAKLTNFEFDPVFPDGHVDLTMDGRDREYNFRSASQSVKPAGVPRNVPVELPCRVLVEIGVKEVSARVIKTEDCDDRLVRHPKCKFASVWKQALANGTPNDVVARIGWLFDEKWFFDVDLEGKGGGVSSFDDRCP